MHPVAIVSAVFCIICSLLMFVSYASGDRLYDRNVLDWALLWLSIICFCFLYVVEVSVLSICLVFRAFVAVLSMWFCM